MKIQLGEKNPYIKYVRYETPSAFRKAGAFLPRAILDMGLYEYRLSPYMGCAKRCQYCFELHNEFIGQDQVKIKTDTVATVRNTIATSCTRKAILLDGYDCEVAEIEERLIRKSLEVLLEYRMPLFIQTKSDLVLRDLDLLNKLNDLGVFVNVSFSLTNLNEEHSRIFEPYTCTPGNRMSAMKTISDNGILTGILLMPVLPFISDTEDDLDRLFSNAAENGCHYIVYEPLRVTSNGPQRDMCFNVLKRHFPDLVERYERLYPNNIYGPKFGAGPIDTGYLDRLSERIERLSKKYNIATCFPKPEFETKQIESKQIISRFQNTLDKFM